MVSQSLGRQPSMEAGRLRFRSDFDSGNCWKVFYRVGDPKEKIAEDCYVEEFKPNPHRELSSGVEGMEIYEIWVASDCMGTEYETKARSWFHFSVEGGVQGETVLFRIMNVNTHEKLYSMDMRAVWRRDDSTNWERTAHRVSHQIVGGNGVLDIPFTFDGSAEKIYLAFTYPYTNEHLGRFLSCFEERAEGNPFLNLTRKQLCLSPDGLPVDLLHLTSTSPPQRKTLPVVLLSARVHPCETPASWILEGFLEGFLEDTERDDGAFKVFAELLAEFEFYIVPCLNPDGVARGHCRNDVCGKNLNRLYGDPDNETSPTIAAFKEFFLALHSTGRLHTFIDCHAHHGKRGWFFYGNNFDALSDQVACQTLPKILSHINPHFDYTGCNFSKSNMSALGGKDGTKEGSARVTLHQATGLVKCYTLECNFNTSNIVASGGKVPPKYTPTTWKNMGYDIGKALLMMKREDLGVCPFTLLLGSPIPRNYRDMKDGMTHTIMAKKEKLKRKSSLKAKLNPDFVKAQAVDCMVVGEKF